MSAEKQQKEIIWNNLKVGDQVTFEKTITLLDVEKFAALSGDRNRLHLDQLYAKSQGFDAPVIQGMLLASYFSNLVGNHFLGDYNLYLSQSLNFRRPVFLGDQISVRGKIINKLESQRLLEIETVILNQQGEIAINGIAQVKCL